MPLFRALAKNMAPMTNADESPTNRLTLFPIYLSLFIVSTLWYCSALLSLRSGVIILNNIVDNIEQCGQQNIVQCCFQQSCGCFQQSCVMCGFAV